MRGKIVHSAHSEGGLIYNRSFEGMSNTEQKKVRRYVEYNGYGPADKTPKSYAEKAINIFSTGDWITGWYKGRSDDKYEVKWVAAQTPLSQRTMYFADHCFLGKTYQQALQNMMENHRRGYASNDR